VKLTRRGLLGSLLLALGIDHLAPLRRGAVEAAAAASPLAPHDLEDLVAFAEVLVEGRGLSPDERRHLVDHVETRIRLNAWYQALYRASVAYLNQLAGARLSTLDVDARIALLTRHRLMSSAIAPDEDLGPLAEQVRQLRTRAVPDLIAGYYGSPVGWGVVGYGTFPGTCGDLARYTRPEP
jgi:hypothetical protein